MAKETSLFGRTASEVRKRVGEYARKTILRAHRYLHYAGLAKAPDTRKVMGVLVDVVGSCNLRCPSCPVGNMGAVNPTGLIKKELLDQALEKANREYRIVNVALYNWAEALLHPELPELVRIVKKHGLRCLLSSNLNVLRNPDELFLSQPDELRISLSGFTQESYGKTHAGGDIERVKANMLRLSESKRKTKNHATRVYVYFHKYKHNLHEVEPMRAYATELGFGWMESWAYFMPLEKAVACAEDRLSAADQAFVDSQFALPIRKAIEAAKQFKDEPCQMYDNQIVLDLKGNAVLCCAVYDFKANTLGSFLEMTPEQFAASKRNHSTCATCTKHGLHRYIDFLAHPQLKGLYEELVAENLAGGDSESPEGRRLRVDEPVGPLVKITPARKARADGPQS